MEKTKGLNANQIKVIAIIAMTVDHLTWAFFPGTQAVWYVFLLHVIGRLTAPIMWFFIAEGCHYTRNMGKYIFRLFLFAVVSHFAYDFAFGGCGPEDGRAVYRHRQKRRNGGAVIGFR